MTTAATLQILLEARDRASPTINTVSGSLGDLGRSSSRSAAALSGMRTAATGALLGVGAGLSGLAFLVGKTGIEFNSLKQQAQISFTTMMGSADLAKAHIAELIAFAAKTPFESADLIRFSQRLQAMGFEAKRVLPLMTSIGDAVAGLGGNAETMDRVVTAMGQIQAKGKASAEEIMQLTEAGIPAWDMLAKKIGVDIPTAMKRVEQGAVSADLFIGAVQEGMNKRFGGMMEAQSKSWAGLWSSVRDTFAQLSGAVMAPLFAIATDGLSKLNAIIATPEFAEGAARLGQALADIATTVISHWPTMQAIIETAYGILTGHTDAVLLALGGLATLLFGIPGALAAVAVAFATDLGGIRTKAEEVVTWFVDNWPRIEGVIRPVAEAVRDIGTDAYEELRSRTEDLINRLEELWKRHDQDLAQAAETTRRELPGAVSAMRDAVLPIWEELRTRGLELVTALQTYWRDNGKLITDAAVVIWDQIRSTGEAFIGVFVALWMTFNDDLRSAAVAAWNGIVDAVRSALSAAGEAVRLFAALLTGDWKTAWDATRKLVQDVADLLNTPFRLAGAAAEGIVRALAEAARDLNNAINITERISRALGDGLNWISNTGRNAVGVLRDLLNVATGLGSVSETLDKWLPGSLPPLAEGFRAIGEEAKILYRELRGVNEAAAEMVPAAAHVSNLANQIASLSGGVTTLQTLQADLRRINLALIEQRELLRNTEPFTERAAAIQKDIQILTAWSAKVKDHIQAEKLLAQELAESRTAIEGYADAMISAGARARAVAQFGALGADALAALSAALADGGPEAGGRVAASVLKLVDRARDLAIPGWEQLAADLQHTFAIALETGDAAAIQAALDAMDRLNAAMAAHGKLTGESWIKALATSMAAEDMQAAIGAAGAKLMTDLGKAISEGGAAIQAASDQAGRIMATMREKLPPELVGRLGRDLWEALQRVTEEQTPETLEAVRNLLGKIHNLTSIVPADFASMADDVRAAVMAVLQSFLAMEIGAEDAMAKVQAIIAAGAEAAKKAKADAEKAKRDAEQAAKAAENEARKGPAEEKLLTETSERRVVDVIGAAMVELARRGGQSSPAPGGSLVGQTVQPGGQTPTITLVLEMDGEVLARGMVGPLDRLNGQKVRLGIANGGVV